MAFMPFLRKKENREKENPQDVKRKIDFAQKLSEEDLEEEPSPKGGKFDFIKGLGKKKEGETAAEDLKGKPSVKGGKFDFIKGLKKKKEGEAVAVTMHPEQPSLKESPVLEKRKEGEAVAVTMHPEQPPLKESLITEKNGGEEEIPEKNWFRRFIRSFSFIRRFIKYGKKDQDKIGERKKLSWALEVNLVKGEIVKFFDWQKGVMLLLVFVFASLTFLSLVYWGITWWGTSRQSVANITNVQSYYRISKEIKDLDPEVNKILKFKNRLDSVNFLLDRHVYWTNFFNFLEDNTLSNVYFFRFTGGVNGDYNLDATTDNIEAINVQIQKLLANPNIKAAGTNGGSVSSTGGKPVVSFSLSLSLEPSIFLK